MEQQTELNPSQEAERIKVLKKYEILDTPPDGSFDKFTDLAAELLEMPIAIISLVDTDRIWFKSGHGLEIQEIGRDPGLCSSAILSDKLYIVEDAAVKDVRTLANPLVAGELGLRFYAGIPLKTREGYNLGTFCVIDRKPRKLSPEKERILQNLADLVMRQMELRLEARQAVRHQHEILSTAAHDLKNPLSVMPVLAEMILENKHNPAAIEKMAIQIKTAGEKMAQTLDDLLQSAREETSQVQLKLGPIDLADLVQRVVTSNEALARNKDLELDYLGEEQCMIYGDERRLTEVIDNLVNNAIKFSPTGKSIQVSLALSEENAILTVKDQGQGLSPDDLNNLFRPFMSLSATPTGDERSTGLGLSIVKNLVEAHEGSIYARSEGHGKGAIFIVELPLSLD